jgi:hypothetical protein
VVATVTGLSGRTPEAPFAGTIWMFAAAGFWAEALLPGVVEAPGVELLCDAPAGAAPVSLQALLTSSTVHIPATTSPYFRAVLLNT